MVNVVHPSVTMTCNLPISNTIRRLYVPKNPVGIRNADTRTVNGRLMSDHVNPVW